MTECDEVQTICVVLYPRSHSNTLNGKSCGRFENLWGPGGSGGREPEWNMGGSSFHLHLFLMLPCQTPEAAVQILHLWSYKQFRAGGRSKKLIRDAKSSENAREIRKKREKREKKMPNF